MAQKFYAISKYSLRISQTDVTEDWGFNR